MRPHIGPELYVPTRVDQTAWKGLITKGLAYHFQQVQQCLIVYD